MQGEDLQELLAQAIRKERLAYRRATYLTAIPVIIGVLVFSFFTYRVLKLRQESARLDEEISDKTQQLDALRASLEVARDESATNAVKAVKSETTLKQIASGVADPRKQARETLTAIAR